MYAALWRSLPGPAWVRTALALALAVLVVVVLFGWGFPAISSWLPFTENTVATGPGGAG